VAEAPLLTRPALELAGLIRAGEITAAELTQLSLAAIAAADPAINACTHVAADTAATAAAVIGAGDRRPFPGVPIAIKDNRAVAGMPLSVGSALLGDHVSASDAHVVTRLRAAGCVIVAKTALPEMGILSVCEPARGGPTANPWQLEHSPGGSSGGSGAAVAAGMVPVAHGTDGGGSIRIPAACCGLVGLKPARGRVSAAPEAGHSFLVSDGMLTRTVADTAALLDVLAGYVAGDATWAPPLAPGRCFADAAAEAATPAPGLRIGLVLDPALPAGRLDPICAEAVTRVAARLESLGHHVEPLALGWSAPDLLDDFTAAFGPLIAMGVRAGAHLAGHPPGPGELEALTWALYEHAQALSSLDHLAAQGRLEALARRVVSRIGAVDAVLTPALAQRPPRTGEIHGRGGPGHPPWQDYRASGAFTPYTAIVNVCGLPAITLPVDVAADGLPVAVQLIGQPAGEWELLALAGALERGWPWHEAMLAPAAGAGPDR
jgi:amidase